MARARDHLRALETKHSELLSELAGLKLEKRALLLRQAMLGSWLGALSMMQLHVAVEPEPDLDDEDDAAEKQLPTLGLLQTDLLLRQQLAVQQHDLAGSSAAQQAMAALDQRPKGWRAKAPLLHSLLQEEVRLLQKLTVADSQEASHQPTLEQLLQPDHSTIAPWSNPMAFLHSFLDRPLLEEAATLSGVEVADNMSSMVQKLGIHLHRLTTVPPWEQPGVLEAIKQSWDRHLHCMTSLVLLGQQDVVEALHCINLETMAYEPVEAAAHQQAQAAVLASMLDLSEQAAELIAVGTRLYYDLLAGVHQERQQINDRMTALQQEPHGTNGNGDTTGGGNSSSGCQRSRKAGPGVEAGSPASGSSSKRLETLPGRQELLEKQQELTDRLNLLLHKEYKLRMAAMSWFIGCLSFEQFSKLAVCSWPYAVRTLFVATHIMEEREKLTQQPRAMRQQQRVLWG